jgi:hypothetical protein
MDKPGLMTAGAGWNRLSVWPDLVAAGMRSHGFHGDLFRMR